MNVTVLVDFDNDSVRTALEVAEALGDDLWGVRLDTSDKLADDRCGAATATSAPTGVARRARRADARRARRHGFERVQIVVSGGFTAERIRAFEAAGVPVDAYGVGSSLIRGSNDFTADVVIVNGAPVREGRARVPAEPAAQPRGVTSGTKRTRSSSWRSMPAPSVRRSRTSRCSPSSTGATSRPPGASCSSSACGMPAAGRRGDVDRVVGRVLGQPARAVADESVTFVDAGRREVRRRLARQRGVDARRSTRAAQPGEQRGVVARAGADVEHALAAAQLEQLAHARDDQRLGDRLARRRSAAARCPTPRRAERAGTNRSRGTARTASSTRSSATLARSRATSRSGRRSRTTPRRPAARSSASARSESPGSHVDAAHGAACRP